MDFPSGTAAHTGYPFDFYLGRVKRNRMDFGEFGFSLARID
jgi:hypothetical protein